MDSAEIMKRVAIIIAEAASLNAEIASMQAENHCRERRGEAPAYVGDDFEDVRLAHPLLHSGSAARFLAG